MIFQNRNVVWYIPGVILVLDITCAGNILGNFTGNIIDVLGADVLGEAVRDVLV